MRTFLLLLVVVACDDAHTGKQREPIRSLQTSTVPIRAERPDSTRLAVQWTFTPAPDERDSIVASLEQFRAGALPSNAFLIGELHRFGAEQSRQRVLLIAIVPHAGLQHVHFHVLPSPSFAVSPLYETGIPEQADNFGDVELDDYDRDGLIDVAYCHWREGQQSRGHAYVVGFRDNRWYHVAKPTRSPPSCPASG
ncbi:MAG: hypothetical protein LH467_02050 [Gemmatimonadaceae bacterium]|nr:hypothetical protein [Gemmatimonadaceae bacterium]